MTPWCHPMVKDEAFFSCEKFPLWILPSSPQGASDEFPQLEEYAQYLSAVVDEESNPRVNAIAKVFGEALERDWRKIHQKCISKWGMMWDLFGFCYFCLNSFWSVCVCVSYFFEVIAVINLLHIFSPFFYSDTQMVRVFLRWETSMEEGQSIGLPEGIRSNEEEGCWKCGKGFRRSRWRCQSRLRYGGLPQLDSFW